MTNFGLYNLGNSIRYPPSQQPMYMAITNIKNMWVSSR
jgi:hypothetical protein